MQVDLPFRVVEFELVHRRGLLLARVQDRRIDYRHGHLGACLCTRLSACNGARIGARIGARHGTCLGTSLGTTLGARLLAHAVSTSRQLALQAPANIRIRGSCRNKCIENLPNGHLELLHSPPDDLATRVEDRPATVSAAIGSVITVRSEAHAGSGEYVGSGNTRGKGGRAPVDGQAHLEPLAGVYFRRIACEVAPRSGGCPPAAESHIFALPVPEQDDFRAFCQGTWGRTPQRQRDGRLPRSVPVRKVRRVEVRVEWATVPIGEL
eukprot:scaffold59379_cov63-Phaeocystis_antarctica.AAC.6